MNTNDKIQEWLNRLTNGFNKGSQLDNIYTPKEKESSSNRFICVQSSINEGSGNFNETFQHIHEQLKPKK